MKQTIDGLYIDREKLIQDPLLAPNIHSPEYTHYCQLAARIRDELLPPHEPANDSPRKHINDTLVVLQRERWPEYFLISEAIVSSYVKSSQPLDINRIKKQFGPQLAEITSDYYATVTELREIANGDRTVDHPILHRPLEREQGTDYFLSHLARQNLQSIVLIGRHLLAQEVDYSRERLYPKADTPTELNDKTRKRLAITEKICDRLFSKVEDDRNLSKSDRLMLDSLRYELEQVDFMIRYPELTKQICDFISKGTAWSDRVPPAAMPLTTHFIKPILLRGIKKNQPTYEPLTFRDICVLLHDVFKIPMLSLPSIAHGEPDIQALKRQLTADSIVDLAPVHSFILASPPKGMDAVVLENANTSSYITR